MGEERADLPAGYLGENIRDLFMAGLKLPGQLRLLNSLFGFQQELFPTDIFVLGVTHGRCHEHLESQKQIWIVIRDILLSGSMYFQYKLKS